MREIKPSKMKIRRGKTLAKGWPVTSPTFDPVGWLIRCQIRPESDNDTVLHEWPSPGSISGFEILEGYGLCVVLRCTHLVTAAMVWDIGAYDVEAVSPGAVDVDLVAFGTALVESEVTR